MFNARWLHDFKLCSLLVLYLELESQLVTVSLQFGVDFLHQLIPLVLRIWANYTGNGESLL